MEKDEVFLIYLRLISKIQHKSFEHASFQWFDCTK
jgi:hypothetical protein